LDTDILASHRSLDAFDDGRDRASILELLGAVLNGYAGASADVLIVCALVRVLEAAPPADVVNQNGAEVGSPGLNVSDQRLDTFATIDAETTFALVRVGPNNLQALLVG
jgi:hypothetical protein